MLLPYVTSICTNPGFHSIACYMYQESMEKAIKNKVAKAVVPAIDVMFQAVR
jgi:hypothetical protein